MNKFLTYLSLNVIWIFLRSALLETFLFPPQDQNFAQARGGEVEASRDQGRADVVDQGAGGLRRMLPGNVGDGRRHRRLRRRSRLHQNGPGTSKA